MFDRGYLDYERFDRMTDDGFFFVSRLRKNAVTRVVESFEVPEQSSVLSDARRKYVCLWMRGAVLFTEVLNYERFDRMTDDGFFFVSRLRKNAVTRVVESFEVPEQSSVLSDELILIGNKQNRAENVFRRIEVLDPNGKELRLITNRFDLNADEVAELYKSRWAIELFF
ncbi:hypothetical protein LSPH26S_00736 [Lysinibacillus sphaericus]